MPSRVRAHQVGLELGDHRQHVEQQPPDGVGRVVHGGAERELHLAGGELVDDRARVGERAREPVELGDHQRVTRAARCERLPQSRAIAVGAGEAVVDVNALGLDAERPGRRVEP
jgi:hypothetical protein